MATLAQSRLRLGALLYNGRARGCSRGPVHRIVATRSYGEVSAAAVSSSSDELGAFALHHGPPPNHPATTAQLETFKLPTVVTETPSNIALGKAMIEAWRKDGIFQISMDWTQRAVLNEAFKRSKEFFKLPHNIKSRHVDSQSFAGYIASGEELTDGIADYSEIFTITKDLPESDPRVKARWPCHGPCPWPNAAYEGVMKILMEHIGDSGEKLLKLVALGLELENPSSLTDLTEDGWHHMRVLRSVSTHCAIHFRL
jgi:isopenicillin N synthase-like dioxygenase